MSEVILDLFAGIGGWDMGIKKLTDRYEILGIDNSEICGKTAELNKLNRITADIKNLNPRNFNNVVGVVGGPPCQSFSFAGDGKGMDDPRGLLTLEPLRWINGLKTRPSFICLEQVPEVLPHWRKMAKDLLKLGYYVWTGIVRASSYGVPQDRNRALLIASNKRFNPPEPVTTRDEMTMASALGHDDAIMVSNYYGANYIDGKRQLGRREMTEPSFTLTGKCKGFKWEDKETKKKRNLTTQECLVLQSFPSDYKLYQREVGQQIGNAIPPMLAYNMAKLVVPK